MVVTCWCLCYSTGGFVLYALYWHCRKPSCQSILIGTIGLYLAAMSVNRLFLDSINPLFFVSPWRFTKWLLILSSLTNAPELTKVSSCQSECHKYRPVSFWDNKLRCYRDTSERHYRPPAVAPSNIIYWLSGVRDGAGRLIMMERADYKPRNNAIISCVISPMWEGKESVLVICFVSHINQFYKGGFFQEALRFAHEWKAEIRDTIAFISRQLSFSLCVSFSLLCHLIIWCIFFSWLDDQWSPFCSPIQHKSSH